MNTPFAGTFTLLRLYLRLDRVRLVIWFVVIIGLVLLTTSAVGNLIADEADATGLTVYEVLEKQGALVDTNRAVVALSGPAKSLGTYGGRYAFELGSFHLILPVVMSILLAVRHTRSDEENGRIELLRSGSVGIWAVVAASGIELLMANGLIGVGIAGAFMAEGIDPARSMLFGLGYVLQAMVFAGIAFVWAQVFEFGRTAVAASLATLAVSFAIRSAGDVSESGLSWVSPLGWVQQFDAFGQQNAAALVVPAIAAVGLGGLALYLSGHRDVGAGLIGSNVGPPGAKPSLVSPLGLAWRLTKGTLAAWIAGVTFLGGMYGTLIEDLERFLDQNESLAAVMEASGVDPDIFRNSFMAMVLSLLAIIGSGGMIQTILRAASEEQNGRAESVLGGSVPRWRWLGSFALIAAGAAPVTMAIGGLALGVGDGLRSGTVSDPWGAVIAGLARVPALWAMAGLAMLLYGPNARLVSVVGGLFAGSRVLLVGGGAVRLPQWVKDLSAFEHVNHRPATDQGLVAVVVLLVLGVGSAAAGLRLFTRRDLV